MRVEITGIVQGVGFRPHVHKLADEFEIRGWVLNNSSGVAMEIEPPPEKGRTHLDEFIAAIDTRKPPLARILTIDVVELPYVGFADFSIKHSERIEGELTLISPDVALCADCLRELFDVCDRRHLYPFINCTNCGPRYSIIGDIPYDRPNTTMAEFAMCAACAREYADVRDRRYHAQPDCCWDCGPQVEYYEIECDSDGGRLSLDSSDYREFVADNNDECVADLMRRVGMDAITATARTLLDGRIVAIKGIGGFHLACDARQARAVGALRARKKRARDKPFALMVANLDAARAICDVSYAEAALLASPFAPIVLLRRKRTSKRAACSGISPIVCADAAPGMRKLGMMLAYAPLHHVIFAKLAELAPQKPGLPHVLVMTSGNLSEEPLTAANDEARKKLGALADAFLLHDRDIRARCDDSVARVAAGRAQLIRHSRGYSPFPVSFKTDGASVLGVGAQKKNTFTLTRERFAFLSPHMGDMENLETLDFFVETLEHYRKLFTISPEAVACDPHPDYLITIWAREFADAAGIPIIEVQHHHAHTAAVLAEHGCENETALGVSFDGTGYGLDGTLWGGEFLIGGMKDFTRFARFHTLRLPGGEGAIREPWRVALAMLHELEDRDLAARIGDRIRQSLRRGEDGLPRESMTRAEPQDDFVSDVQLMLDRDWNCVPTSSCGRLFDGVSAMLGLCLQASYEGQAAMLLEEALDVIPDSAGATGGTCYDWRWYQDGGGTLVFDWRIALQQIAADVVSDVRPSIVALRFHDTIAAVILDAAVKARDTFGTEFVALSGGCFQNAYLLEKTVELLVQSGFRALWGCLVPPNDAGVSLGQAAVARAKFHK